MERKSGVLLPISSLWSPYGIGTFSKAAYEFVDFLVKSGQSYWQILPLGPTSIGDSPYQSFSTFAGNPYFIDLDQLVKEKLLKKAECAAADCTHHPNYVEYGDLYNKRFELLRKAYERSKCEEDAEYLAFVKENESWLEDYALFMAVKKCFGGQSWLEWAEDIRKRWDFAMDHYRTKYAEEIGFYKFMQFKFAQQWKKLKTYANEKGIRIIGDIPIYVALDSADVWANPGLFQMDEEGKPTKVAGCPPDAFSDDGQLWGNPLYRWDVHKSTGYAWWMSRMANCFKLYDIVRIDHFRGFDEYYAIPYGDETAKNGKWEKGPGMDLFTAMEKTFGKKDVIAEDLGYMTDTVRKLVKDSGYPNMKVLGFAFDESGASDHLPQFYNKNMVCYTGTHDNETMIQMVRGWKKKKKTAKFVGEYLNTDMKNITEEDLKWTLIRQAMLSVADTCIIPVQDLLGLGAEARMNFPSTLGNNWKWRASKEMLSPELSKKLKALTRLSCRL